jgi:NADPH:quinone reductase-like Zn-dependent oxidoreductase
MSAQLVLSETSSESSRKGKEKTELKAAVLHKLGDTPRFEDFADPQAAQGEVLVRVKAASLKNSDTMMASGTHYDSHSQLPVVCGMDGVGILEDGARVFCGGSRPPFGMMAERTVVSRMRCMPVPDNVGTEIAAALPNPALSSWLPLIWRAEIKRGETVLILGATGVAGKLAIQIAKHLGAGRVVAAGRNKDILESLHELGADATISLELPDGKLRDALLQEARSSHFDIVLDYLWGHPTEVLLDALTGHDTRAVSARVRLIEIGEMAGAAVHLSAAALRSSAVEIYGSGGGGTVPPQAIFDAIPQVWSLAAQGKLLIDIENVPLAEVGKVWRQDSKGRRIVLVP